MGEDVLGAVAASAEGLGQPPVALIQLTRAWLVVEGEHDRRIVEHFYGRDLRAARISVLPLRGAARAKASFLNLGALAPLGIPFFCLLDNAMVEAVRAGRTERPDMTEEERIAEQLILLAMRDGLQLDVLGLPFPDIICALPMGAVRAVVVEHDGKMEAATSWKDLLERHRRACDAARGRGVRPPGFKSFILEDVGLRGWSPDRLIDEVLAVSSGMLPASALSQRMMEIIAAVSSESPARSR